MRQYGRINTDQFSNLIDKRKQFIELLRADKLIFGTRIGHNVIFIHLLVDCSHSLCTQSARSKPCRQSCEIQQLRRGCILHHFRILHNRTRCIAIRNIAFFAILRFFRTGINDSVFILKSILKERNLFVIIHELNLISDNQHHCRFQTPLAQNGMPIPGLLCNTCPLH